MKQYLWNGRYYLVEFTMRDGQKTGMCLQVNNAEDAAECARACMDPKTEDPNQPLTITRTQETF